MRFFQIHDFYRPYLAQLYAKDPQLAQQSFEQQIERLILDGFSGIHVLPPEMSALGWESYFSVSNCGPLQAAWARQYTTGAIDQQNWEMQLAVAQVDAFQPDILYLGHPILLDSRFIRRLKKRPRLVIGWRGAKFPPETDYSEFDIILSHDTQIKKEVLQAGAKSVEHFFPGFPQRIVDSIGSVQKGKHATFCGSWTALHEGRNRMLSAFAANTQLRSTVDLRYYLLSEGAPLPAAVREIDQGPRFGLDMYSTIAESAMVFNGTTDYQSGEAGNMRCFETTGCGTMLLTNAHPTLSTYFEPGSEVETFHSAQELEEKLQYYSEHPDQVETIARKGQQRCLNEHSLMRRAEEFQELVKRKLGMTKVTPQRENTAAVSFAQLERSNQNALRQEIEAALEAQEFDRALEIELSNPGLLSPYAHAWLLIKLGRLEEARVLIAQSSDPLCALLAAQVGAGETQCSSTETDQRVEQSLQHIKDGNLPGAVEKITEIFDLGEEPENSQYALGLCLYALGKLDAAKMALEREVQLHPHLHDARQFLDFVRKAQ